MKKKTLTPKQNKTLDAEENTSGRRKTFPTNENNSREKHEIEERNED